MVTSAQLRAARALLNWTVRDLALQAAVHRNTVTRAETGETNHGHAVAAIIRAFEAAGVEFTNGGEPGVKLKRKISQGGELQSPKGPGQDLCDAEAG
jgi:transcriptional regulator with XRE-family HTH domain